MVLVALLTFVQIYRLGWTLLGAFDESLFHRLFGGIRNCFVVAGAAWLIDRVACGSLNALPFAMPNPQLHAFGWHIGCALGVNQAMVAVLIMRTLRRNTNVKRVRLKTLLGCVPYDIECDFAESRKRK